MLNVVATLQQRCGNVLITSESDVVTTSETDVGTTLICDRVTTSLCQLGRCSTRFKIRLCKQPLGCSKVKTKTKTSKVFVTLTIFQY